MVPPADETRKASTSAGIGKDGGASGTSTSGGPNMTHAPTIVGPTPNRRERRPATSAPASPPTLPSVSTSPISSGDIPSVRTAYTRRIDPQIIQKKFVPPVVSAIARQ